MSGFNNYLWSTGATTNFITVTQTGNYSLQVTDKNGCKATESTNIKLENCIIIQIPNVFTPNKDGKNDGFKPLLPFTVSEYNMQIWNRYGQIIFETKDSNTAWDGSFKGNPQSIGTYIYLINLKDYTGKIIQKKGTFILIR